MKTTIEIADLPWVVVLVFLRLVTREAMIRRPLDPERA